jgi:hypothetical protein
VHVVFRFLASLALASPLIGCTPMHWVREGTHAAQTDADVWDCASLAREEMWRRERLRRPTPRWYRDPEGRPLFGKRGDPFDNGFLEETELTHACLRARGYRLEASR